MTTEHRTLASGCILGAGIGLLCLASGCCCCTVPHVLPCDPPYGYRPTCWRPWQDACMVQGAAEMPPQITPDLPGLPQAAPGVPMPPPGRPAGELIHVPPPSKL
ncbi:MAG: hypothetical protein ABSG68_21270 [Thermoguttaceae bacterium]